MGSKYQLVPLAPACCQNLARLHCAEEDATPQITPFHRPIYTFWSPAIFAECSPLWACCAFFGAWSYNLSHLNHAAERADEIIPLSSATAVNPQGENKFCMAGSIAVAQRLHVQISIQPKDSVMHFSLSCAPEGKKQGMDIRKMKACPSINWWHL